MRSSQSGPDPLDPGPRGFAHRGLHGPQVRENSLAAFDAAITEGAGIELDVLLSYDHVPLVLHGREDLVRFGTDAYQDPREPLLAHEAGRILPDGFPLAPTLEQTLDLVGGRVPVLVEIKAPLDRISNPGLVARQVCALLTDYSGPVGVMSFHPFVPNWLSRHAPHIRRGLVLAADCPAFERRWRMLWARPQFLAVGVAALGRSWITRARRRMPVYSWTIRTAEQRRQAVVQADALIWEGDGRPRI